MTSRNRLTITHVTPDTEGSHRSAWIALCNKFQAHRRGGTHVMLKVRNLKASVSFYRRALAPLGYVIENPQDSTPGFGPAGAPQFRLAEKRSRPTQRVHVAFKAHTRAEVDEFYKAALAAGGRDNGPPGLRPDYAPGYYAVFVCDPDGNNIEVVRL